MAERKIFSVSEVTRDIKAVLEGKFPGIWVEGEISNYRVPFSGHRYFSLKDEFSQLKAVLFKNAGREIKFELKDGLSVICFGRISVYEPSGQYQLYVEKVEPKGIGALQMAFEQLKKKLAAEGLFAPEKKRSLPQVPQRIGVVTSPTGAAIRDILKVVERRFANVEILINPVRVQGAGAAGEISRAIDDFNRMKNVDVLIVGRGGGSIEDLWAFNEEAVARAIFRSRIPVISAVGHEIDWTISDFVADLRAPTPSAAAELVVKEKKELAGKIEDCRARMAQALTARLERLREEMQRWRHRFRLRHPLTIIRQQQQRLDDLSRLLVMRLKHYLELKGAEFRNLTEKLQVLSPLNVLTRGYSITLTVPEEKVVKDAGKLRPGDEVKTVLGRGSFSSKVRKINGK